MPPFIFHATTSKYTFNVEEANKFVDGYHRYGKKLDVLARLIIFVETMR